LTNDYAVASRDELWSAGARIESRLTYGRALRNGDDIVASDARDDELVARCEARFAELRAVIEALAPLRQRGVVEVTREDGELRESSTLTIAFGAASIVTTPEHAREDAAMLRALMSTAPVVSVDPHAYPILWRGGSAAVLFHEAVGHAAEHAHAAIEWPSWLHVSAPLALRRASFRDVPLPRMTSLIASADAAPFALPETRLEVHLVEGGLYEPLTEEVTLRIAVADLVDGDEVRRVKPFELRASRREIAHSLLGATGEPLRYPGVICSREGQELVVGSYSPLVLTASILLPPGEGAAERRMRGAADREAGFTAPLTRPSATLSRTERGETYRKRGSVVRREGSVLLRVKESGEAIDDGATFITRPINGDIDDVDAQAVIDVAERLTKLNPERLIVTDGIAHHECDGRTWSESSRRIHLALTHQRMRTLIDHADFEQLEDIEQIARALKNVKDERNVRVRLAPAVTAALLPSLIDKIEIEQLAAPHDGRGNAIEKRDAKPPPPNVFRPTYRQRPIAMPFNLAAKPFGVIDETAPLAIAIVNGAQLLCINDDDAFLTPLKLSRITAVSDPVRWYPYAAGSFGAWMML